MFNGFFQDEKIIVVVETFVISVRFVILQLSCNIRGCKQHANRYARKNSAYLTKTRMSNALILFLT